MVLSVPQNACRNQTRTPASVAGEFSSILGGQKAGCGATVRFRNDPESGAGGNRIVD